LLIGWFVSWLVLHFALKRREIRLYPLTIAFLIGMALATLFIYTPFIDFMLGM
jgi:hypothetical protein